MTIYNCIIVDDEPLARKILQDYVALLPNLHLAGLCKNASEALTVLHQTKIDLIFCDIQMPGVNGLQLAKSLHYSPKIIITSAYSEYAIEGFNLGVADYILKPISIDRFLLAVNRALNTNRPIDVNVKTDAPEFMFFKTGTSNERVFLSNIDYIEAYGNYSKLHLIDQDKYLVINHKISELENELRQKNFIRIHKSYIINQAYLRKISAHSVYINTMELPLGESYRKKVSELVKAEQNHNDTL